MISVKSKRVQVKHDVLKIRFRESDMKWFLNILGVLFILVGIVWFFQGINILLGSFMTGQPLYAVLGVILGAVGGVLIFLANRKRRVSP